MIKSVKSKLLMSVLLFSLVFSLSGFGQAYALTAGEISTQAAKSTIYVVSSEDTGAKYTYNKYGLISKAVNGTTSVTYKYNGTKVSSITYKDTRTKAVNSVKYTYSGNKVTKVVAKNTYPGQSDYTSTTTYKYNKKNQIISSSSKDSDNQKFTTKYTYYSNGLPKTWKDITSTGTNSYSYTYDKNKNLTSLNESYAYGWKVNWNYANTYDKNKNLTKRVMKDTGNLYNARTKTFKYKKISVDKKYASLVKEQQQSYFNISVLPRMIV